MIELIRVVKRFGDLIAVNDVSLTVRPGEVFALLGPNAAGKTTTLKLLTGLMKPSSGHARLCGHDVQAQPMEARRQLAYVPDFPFLYDKLTPEEFLRFTGRLFEMNSGRLDTAIHTLVERFHLAPHARMKVETLSHGTKQRVAIAAALLHEPRVVVIDEPMVGLDPQHARVVKDALKEQAATGSAVLMSTHQLAVAEELADRIGIIHQGRLTALGTKEELRLRSGADGPLEAVFLALTQGAGCEAGTEAGPAEGSPLRG